MLFRGYTLIFIQPDRSEVTVHRMAAYNTPQYLPPIGQSAGALASRPSY
ncbi:MAG: hypothetical protein N6V49_04395 [Serratia symbiotica]|nr:hypothetical protein [Serratia symbiotica]